MYLLLLRNSPSKYNKHPQSYDIGKLNLSCHEHLLFASAHHYELCHFTLSRTQS